MVKLCLKSILSYFRHTHFLVKMGGYPHAYLAIFRNFHPNFANYETFYKCFELSRQKKTFFFQSIFNININVINMSNMFMMSLILD